MKKLAILVLCLLLTGCQALTFSVDGLLSAPNVADEQSAIYQALIESAGRGINLEYPKNGEHRSAFVPYDIDGDYELETLAFYSVSSVAESNVKIAVLDRDETGRWRSMYELAGAGSAVDKVMFLGNDMVVGYSAQEYEENAVRLYRYTDGVLESIYENSYSILEMADLDGCGIEEIAVIKRSGEGIEMNVLKAAGELLYDLYSRSINIGVTSVAGYCFGDVGNGKALYIDLTSEDFGISTQIVYLGSGVDGLGILAPLSGSNELTRRPTGYLSLDYDGDGIVEIPVLEPFTGYSYSSWGEAEYLTRFYRLDATGTFLEPKSVAYYNVRDSYILSIPNRWMNLVTVTRDQGTGELTFREYDPALPIAEMRPLMSFASADSSAGEAYSNSGYTLMTFTEWRDYYVRIRAPQDEPLILTMDEISDNFYPIK